MDRQGQRLKALPLRVERSRLPRLQVTRERTAIHRKRKKRRPQRNQPQRPSRRGAERFQLSNCLLGRGVRSDRILLFIFCHNAFFPYSALQECSYYTVKIARVVE